MTPLTAATASDTLQVKHLQLPVREAAQLLPRVEDALRTASRPVALTQRWVCVKQLQLRTPRGASAAQLARQFSGAWQALMAQARPLAEAHPSDEVVWAADEATARLQLLQQWLNDAPCQAWFWGPVARSAGLHSAQRPPGDSACAQAMAALLSAPWAGAAAADHAARPADGWREAAALFTAAAHQPLAAQLGAHLPAPLQPAWRAALVLAPPQGAARPARASAAPPARPPGEHAATQSARPPHTAQAAAPASAQPPQGAARASHAAGPAAAAAAHAQAPAAVAHPAPPPAATGLHGQPSAWAGLWLLLPLLRMSRLDAGGEARHTRALALALMQRAACRWGLDPLCRDWITAAQAGQTAPSLPSEQAHAVSQPPSAIELDAAWHTARLHTLQHARLPLRRLLHRPGQVWLAPHRVDVQFALRSAHIGIRRAGLDIDPGYLPWLDTVLHFHYV